MAQFTLHDSWNELKRYTNLRPEKVRDLLLRDRLRVGEVNCAFCGYEKHAGMKYFAVKAKRAGRELVDPPARAESRGKQTRLF